MSEQTRCSKTFVVSTKVTRNGTAYMGPSVTVSAKNASEARRLVAAAGHKVNENFVPEQIDPKPWSL